MSLLPATESLLENVQTDHLPNKVCIDLMLARVELREGGLSLCGLLKQEGSRSTMGFPVLELL